MYRNVPRIVSCTVRPALWVGAPPSAPPPVGALSLARPKSRSFVPALIEHPRLQIPMHDPLPVRLVQCICDLNGNGQRLIHR